jgi:hypothetical protein
MIDCRRERLLLQHARVIVRPADDHVGRGLDQGFGPFDELIVTNAKSVWEHREVLTLDKAEQAHFIEEGDNRGRLPAGRNHGAEAIDAARLLSRRSERPS